MINFHKFGFLDAKKLKNYVENKNYWLNRYNPIWLFIWKDLYKPEIAYDNDFCYIRYLEPNVGIVYYPPLGEKRIEDGIKKIQADAFEHGYDVIFGPVVESSTMKFNELKFNMLENEQYNNYVYVCDNLSQLNKNKAFKNKIKSFFKYHPNAYYRKAKKEDFPKMLEFIENWRTTQSTFKDKLFFDKLASIKVLMEHLYEFNLYPIMLEDEDRIYGISIISYLDNMAYLNLCIALMDEDGAYEFLVETSAKEAQLKAKYINLEEDYNDDKIKKEFEEFKPYTKEKFYATFRL